MAQRFIRYGNQIIRSATGDLFKTSLYNLNDRCLAYYKFDDSSTITFVDSRGNINLQTYSRIVDRLPYCGSTGRVSTCIGFNASTSSVSTTAGADGAKLIPGSREWSMSFWCKIDGSIGSYANNAIILYKGDEISIRSDYVGSSASKLIVAWDIADGTDYYMISRDSIFNELNVWKHIVIVIAYNNLKIYVDGLDNTGSKSSTPYVYPMNMKSGSNSVYLGGVANTAASMKGCLDEVGFWDRALTKEEVEVLYNAGQGLTYPFTITNTLLNGLMAYWPLDETSGSYYNMCSSSNSYKSSYIGTFPRNSEGKLGYCPKFDSSGDYMTLNASDWIREWDSISYSFWTYPSVDPCTEVRDMTLFYVSSPSPDATYHTYVRWYYSTNKIEFVVYDDLYNIGGKYNIRFSNVVLNSSTWTHIALTDTYGNMRIYFNGVDVTNTATGGLLRKYKFTSSSWIFLSASNTSRTYLGKIDEFAVWNRVLTPKEVSTLYNNGEGYRYPFTSKLLANDLIGYWKLDDVSGNLTLKDSLGLADGSCFNAWQGADGKIGYGVKFPSFPDSSNMVLKIPRVSSGTFPSHLIIDGDQMTISLWAKLHTLPHQWQDVLGRFFEYKSDVYPYQTHRIYCVESGSKWTFRTNDASLIAVQVYRDVSVSVDTWYHVVGVCQGYGKDLILYVNGASDNQSGATKTLTTPILCSSLGVNICNGIAIGNSYTPGTNAPNATIDEVGLWKRALTNNEILSLYNNGNGLTYPF